MQQTDITTDTEDEVVDVARIEQLMNEKAAAIFQLCDRESKGFLTKDDMRRLETELPLSAEQLEQVFDSLDANGHGFLTKSEFASGFGHFLGLTVCNADDLDPRLESTVVYECDTDSDVADASDQFDDMLKNLGAVGLLENEDVIKSIWLRLRHQPQLQDNFEMLLRRLTSQLHRSRVDYYALQKTFRANSWEHDEEMLQLYKEMEQHIDHEKQRIEEGVKWRAVSTAEGQSLAAEYDALFYETSAKSGHNIDTSISDMTRLLRKRQSDKLSEAYHLKADTGKKKSCC